MLRLPLVLAFASLTYAQLGPKSSSDMKFEVATLKPAVQDQQTAGIRIAPGGERYVANNASLITMLTVAYRIRDEQIVGGPNWIRGDRFDMNAKAERVSSAADLRAMLADLLIERFQLKFHREKKELPMYALTVDRGGPKLKQHNAANSGDPWIEQYTERLLQAKISAKFSPMDYFAFRLSTLLDRPVVDHTGLTGEFDFDLYFTRELPPGVPENAMLNGTPLDTSGPNVFAAVKQQLGLELKPQKGLVDVVVIDSASKLPSN